jgi:cytokinin dehydrogenase
VPSAFWRNFGGMKERRPAVVLRPRGEGDLVIALQAAAARGVPITTRGAGHSQATHALGVGLLIDMTSYDDVEVASDGTYVDAAAGASWQHVFSACTRHGRLPVAPTHALDTTIGGTLCVGGLGAQSFRFGAQVDNVEYLDVLTLDGQRVRCSAHAERALFDAVRAGLGQCGLIVRVGYPVRPQPSRVRIRCFAFQDPNRFLEAARAFAEDGGRTTWLTGAIRPGAHPERPWLYLFFGEVPNAQSTASAADLGAELELGSQEVDLWSETATSAHPFFRVFGNSSDKLLRPWVDHLYTPAHALQALEHFLRELEGPVGRGSANLLFVKRSAAVAPLLRAPADELLLGISALTVFGSAEGAEAERAMLDYAERARQRGGYRYLSGFLGPMPVSAWREHYHDAWAPFAAAKERYDPLGLLNPGLVAWR